MQRSRYGAALSSGPQTQRFFQLLVGGLFCLAVLGGVVPAADAQINPVNGAYQVAVFVHAGPTPTSSTDRREHIAISSALASETGLTVGRQLRVVIENPSVQGATSTANFTVAEIFQEGDHAILIHPPNSNSDQNNGVYKLFVTSDPLTVDFNQVVATVYPATPSTTILHQQGMSTDFPILNEPNNGTSKHFIEEVTVSPDKRAVLLVPHGGNIELRTSDMVAPVLTTWDGHQIDGNVWDIQGTWGSGQTYKRWHITSPDIHEDSHPGLEYLLADPPFAFGQDFQYALSVHGFSWSNNRKGLLIGGRANIESKCFMLERIRTFISDQYHDPNYDLSTHIYDAHGADWAFPGDDGAAPNYSYLAGTSSDNIVNRLSPNINGNLGHGGIQLELSSGLRLDADLRDLVAKGAADAIALLIQNPNRGAVCNTL